MPTLNKIQQNERRIKTAQNTRIEDQNPRVAEEEEARRLITTIGSRGWGVTKDAEWRRIVALPMKGLDEKIPDLTPIWLKADADCEGCDLCEDGLPRLRLEQCAMLLEAEKLQGLMAFVGVGFGKTLASLLLPDVIECERALLLVPSRVKKQLLFTDIPRYGKHFKLPLQKLRVLSYSEIQVESGCNKLRDYDPDLIICDEFQNLKNPQATRVRRFRELFKERRRRLCILSGTPGDMKNYGYLATLALGNASPVPNNYLSLQDWDNALSKNTRDNTLAAGAILDLCGEEIRHKELTAESIENQIIWVFEQPKWREIERSVGRRVFQRRLKGSHGVVTTSTSSSPCEVILRGRQLEIPPVVKEHLDNLETYWEIGEEELRDAKDVSRVANLLLQGYYHVWQWPETGPDTEWLTARSVWFKCIRDVLKYRAKPGLDTPLFVSRAAKKGLLNAHENEAWKEWNRVGHRWNPSPPIKAIWLSDYMVNDILKWAAERTAADPGIVWYQNRALEEALIEHGAFPVFGGGDDRVEQYKGTVCAASLRSHGTGKNLQHFNRGLVVTSPANRIAWEQLIGRNARPGQKAPTVVFEVYQFHEAQRKALRESMAGAKRDDEELGQNQIILTCKKENLFL